MYDGHGPVGRPGCVTRTAFRVRGPGARHQHPRATRPARACYCAPACTSGGATSTTTHAGSRIRQETHLPPFERLNCPWTHVYCDTCAHTPILKLDPETCKTAYIDAVNLLHPQCQERRRSCTKHVHMDILVSSPAHHCCCDSPRSKATAWCTSCPDCMSELAARSSSSKACQPQPAHEHPHHRNHPQVYTTLHAVRISSSAKLHTRACSYLCHLLLGRTTSSAHISAADWRGGPCNH